MKPYVDYVAEIKQCKNCTKKLSFVFFRKSKEGYILPYCLKCENLKRNRSRFEKLLSDYPDKYTECDGCSLIYRIKVGKCPSCFPLEERPKIAKKESCAEIRFRNIIKDIPEEVHFQQIVKSKSATICIVGIFGRQKISKETFTKIMNFAAWDRVTMIVTEALMYKFRKKRRVI